MVRPRRFTKYPKLPPELQQKIVGFAMVPRILEFDLVTTVVETFTTHIRTSPVPSLLHANKAIREETLRKYKLITAPHDFSFQYINLEIDTIYILTWSHHRCVHSGLPPNLPLQLFKTCDPVFLAWQGFPERPFHVYPPISANDTGHTLYRQIKHIAVPGSNHFSMYAIFFNPAGSQTHELLYNLPCLATFTVVYDDRTRNRKLSPQTYKFDTATGRERRLPRKYACFHSTKHDTQEECWGYDYASYLTDFENGGKQEEKADYMKNFWEANPDWKKPELRTRSTVEKCRWVQTLADRS